MSERAASWRDLIARQADSGLSVVAFCERQQVSPASFYAWRRRLAEAPRASFVPVRVAAASHDGPALELERPDGTLIRIFDGAARQTIADVLAALDSSAGCAGAPS